MDEIDTETETEDAVAEPWALLPSEVVCRNANCNLAYHRPLGECPTCKELAR
jgi:hypothetical protein